MSNGLKLSEYCLTGRDVHLSGFKGKPLLPTLVPRLLLGFQRNMFFTGLGGLAWRLMGVTRSDKNPNFCQG